MFNNYEMYKDLDPNKRLKFLKMIFEQKPIHKMVNKTGLSLDTILLIGAVVDDLIVLSREAQEYERI